MRRIAVFGVVAAVAVATLTGCTTGPNQEAVKAAESYGDALTTWAGGLADALPDARTATPDERKDDGPDFEEVGLGDALADPPALKKVEGVENTPTYLFAAEVAEQVDAAAAELRAIEPDGLKALRALGSDAYTVVADLYYDSLDADGKRLEAFTAALELDRQSPAYDDAIREAWKGFFAARGELVTKAGKDSAALKTDNPLGTSLAAFMTDWYDEEAAFDEKAVEVIGANTVYADAYGTYWGVGNLNSVLSAIPENAAALRAGYVQQIGDLADAVDAMNSASPAPSAGPSVPALGEPYRQLLLDGYLPWGDPGEGTVHATDRLWMLWRIRELEGTPDKPYAAARVALFEEINRGLESNQRSDHRPGADRLLELIGEYSDNFETYDLDERVLTRLTEITAYGKALREVPMLPAVADDFDKVLALYDELNGELADALETYTDEYDRMRVLSGLGIEYEKKVTDAATPSLTIVDDDAQMKALLAEAIEATRPSGQRGGSGESPKPTPSLSLGNG